MYRTFLPFIEWLECQVCGSKSYGILRLFDVFDDEVGPLADDGMPARPYVWCCFIERDGDELLIKGAMTAPPPESLRTLMQLGKSIAKTVRWERLRGTMLQTKTFLIDKHTG